MARRSFIVFLLFVAGGVSTLSAADKTSFGLGIAPLVRWDVDGTDLGMMLEIGYQF